MDVAPEFRKVVTLKSLSRSSQEPLPIEISLFCLQPSSIFNILFTSSHHRHPKRDKIRQVVIEENVM